MSTKAKQDGDPATIGNYHICCSLSMCLVLLEVWIGFCLLWEREVKWKGRVWVCCGWADGHLPHYCYPTVATIYSCYSRQNSARVLGLYWSNCKDKSSWTRENARHNESTLTSLVGRKKVLRLRSRVAPLDVQTQHRRVLHRTLIAISRYPQVHKHLHCLRSQ